MTDRYIIDDAGTLIDMETREMYNIVEEVCPILNQYNNKLNTYKSANKLQQATIQRITSTIKEAYNNERTDIGKMVLKQLIQNIGVKL